jgi:hypothetical protein
MKPRAMRAFGQWRRYLMRRSERNSRPGSSAGQTTKTTTKKKLLKQTSSNVHHKEPVFGIKVESPMVMMNPEKVKIMAGFFQIYGNFQTMYKIVWPPVVSQAMHVWDQFNLVLTRLSV